MNDSTGSSPRKVARGEVVEVQLVQPARLVQLARPEANQEQERSYAVEKLAVEHPELRAALGLARPVPVKHPMPTWAPTAP